MFTPYTERFHFTGFGSKRKPRNARVTLIANTEVPFCPAVPTVRGAMRWQVSWLADQTLRLLPSREHFPVAWGGASFPPTVTDIAADLFAQRAERTAFPIHPQFARDHLKLRLVESNHLCNVSVFTGGSPDNKRLCSLGKPTTRGKGFSHAIPSTRRQRS